MGESPVMSCARDISKAPARVFLRRFPFVRFVHMDLHETYKSICPFRTNAHYKEYIQRVRTDIGKKIFLSYPQSEMDAKSAGVVLFGEANHGSKKKQRMDGEPPILPDPPDKVDTSTT